MGEGKFELAQLASSLVSTELRLVDGCVGLRDTQLMRFIRLPNELGEESLPHLQGKQLELLKNLCLVANVSEEFFMHYRKNQWLRTAITYANNPKALFSLETLEQESHLLIPDNRVTIQCNVVPCSPYWRRLEEKELQTFGGVSPCCCMSKRVFFPCDFIDKAIVDKTTLMGKLHETCNGGPCTIASRWHEGDDSDEGDLSTTTSREMLKIESPEIVVKQLAVGGQGCVYRVFLGKGMFAKKVFYDNSIYVTELDMWQRISHPNIVYIFGVRTEEETKQGSLYMELLENDLNSLIFDRIRIDGSQPPFSPRNSVHILLQIAHAMAYLHSQTVIHGDLKSPNILVSPIEVLGEVQEYLVKVADFGSAQLWRQGMTPSNGTTNWAAPEVLVARHNGPIQLNFNPYKTDVYSFGIIAFEVLTGLAPYPEDTQVKQDVHANKRPDKYLSTNSLEYKFWHEHPLVALIERCWNKDPIVRPLFPEICKELMTLDEKITKSSNNSGWPVGFQLPVLLSAISLHVLWEVHDVVISFASKVFCNASWDASCCLCACARGNLWLSQVVRGFCYHCSGRNGY